MNDPNRYTLDRLRRAIRPLRLHWLPRVGSTNDWAARMRRAGNLFAPALVLAGAQVAGRGRGERTWWSGDGCITATLVLPVSEQILTHQLPLVVGLAVRNASAELIAAPVPARSIALKWPNDLLIGGHKLAGVLCERVAGADLIGIGMNVNRAARNDPPPALRDRIAWLAPRGGESLNKTDVLIAIVKQVYAAVSRRADHPFPTVLREYDRHHALRGQRVSVIVPHDARLIRGTCTGLDTLGRLLVRDGRARQFRIVAGHVRMANGRRA